MVQWQIGRFGCTLNRFRILLKQVSVCFLQRQVQGTGLSALGQWLWGGCESHTPIFRMCACSITEAGKRAVLAH